MTTVSDSKTSGESVRRLAFAVRELMPWAAFGASQHSQNSSHADRAIGKARDAMKALGYSFDQASLPKVEDLEQSELDQLRAKYDAIIDQTNEMRWRHDELVRVGRLMIQCRSGSGEDDVGLYQQLEALIAKAEGRAS